MTRRNQTMPAWLIVHLALYAVITAFFSGCASAPDPISRFVARVSSDGFWRYGIYPTVELPKTAPREQVTKRIFETTDFNTDSGIRPVTKYKIVKIRQVNIPAGTSDLYTVALVQTDLGAKIVVFQYEEPAQRWWSRVFDAQKSTWANQ